MSSFFIFTKFMSSAIIRFLLKVPIMTTKKSLLAENPELAKSFDLIAQECLDIDTLETRNSDSLDFYDCSVWSIRNALTQAYELGKAAGKAK